MNETLELQRANIDTARLRYLPLLHMRRPSGGWIATVRTALGMPQHVLAKRLGFSKQRVSQLEARELSGEITLTQLQDVAAALGCKFVYALVPDKPLSDTVHERARAFALEQLGAVDRTMQLEDQQTPLDEKRIADYITRHVSERDLWRS
jgi:predicted DNA-binding mobile mystery protein A